MIESVYKKIHTTGIIEIIINTTDKWIEFQINRLTEEHKIVMSFYPNCDPVFPPDSEEVIEYIDMKNDFDPFKYMIYSNQCKDQITLILVPRTLLMNKQDWKEYGSM